MHVGLPLSFFLMELVCACRNCMLSLKIVNVCFMELACVSWNWCVFAELLCLTQLMCVRLIWCVFDGTGVRSMKLVCIWLNWCVFNQTDVCNTDITVAFSMELNIACYIWHKMFGNLIKIALNNFLFLNVVQSICGKISSIDVKF